jgi:hypothetical protein
VALDWHVGSSRKERANPRSLAPLGHERNLDQAQQE